MRREMPGERCAQFSGEIPAPAPPCCWAAACGGSSASTAARGRRCAARRTRTLQHVTTTAPPNIWREKNGARFEPAVVTKPATIKQLAAASAVGCVPAALNADARVVHTSVATAEPRETLPAETNVSAPHEHALTRWQREHRIEKRVLLRLSGVKWTRKWIRRRSCRRLQPDRWGKRKRKREESLGGEERGAGGVTVTKSTRTTAAAKRRLHRRIALRREELARTTNCSKRPRTRSFDRWRQRTPSGCSAHRGHGERRASGKKEVRREG